MYKLFFMNTVLQTISLLIITGLSQTIQSQTQSGPFTVTGAGYSTAVVTDYQCVGLNPANLGWKRNSNLMNFGAGEGTISIYSEPLKRTLVNELFSPSTKFTDEERQEAVQNFTETKLQFEGNVSGVGISFQDDKIGGFGFAIKERIVWDSFLNEQSADLLFNGYNSSYFDTIQIDAETGDSIGISLDPEYVTKLFNNTYLEMLWFREYNLSYGRSILKNDKFTLFGGIGFKYIRGYSVFNYSYKDGVIDAYSALNPTLGVDYDTYSPSEIENNEFQSVGTGWGLDFGVSALLYNKLRLALTLTDLGQIKWDGNVYEGEDAFLNDIESSGLDNYNIFELDDNVAFDHFKWGGWKGLENKTTKLPTNFRFGGAYLLKEKYEFGSEFYFPVNEVPGSYDKLIFGVGTRLQPVKWFRGSIGVVAGGATGTNVPMGISFFPFNNSSFSWEIGLAVRDITSYFSQNNPTVSLAIGLLRFSFGQSSNGQEEVSTD
jgi:hypothetical protein